MLKAGRMAKRTGLRAICTDREIALMAIDGFTIDKLTAAEREIVKAAARKVIASGWKGLR